MFSEHVALYDVDGIDPSHSTSCIAVSMHNWTIALA